MCAGLLIIQTVETTYFVHGFSSYVSDLHFRVLPSGTSATSTSSSKPTRSGGGTILRTSPERLREKLQRKSWNILVVTFLNNYYFLIYPTIRPNCSYGGFKRNFCLCLLQLYSGNAVTSCRILRRSWLRLREARPGSSEGLVSRKRSILRLMPSSLNHSISYWYRSDRRTPRCRLAVTRLRSISSVSPMAPTKARTTQRRRTASSSACFTNWASTRRAFMTNCANASATHPSSALTGSLNPGRPW